jgi:hypothetical protein
MELFDDWHDPSEFFIARNRFAIRTRALSSDVKDIGTSVFQSQSMVDSIPRKNASPSVRKTIRSGVYNPHDPRHGSPGESSGTKLP